MNEVVEINHVSYEEVSDIFESAKYWTDEQELFWYQHAWKILEEQKATYYSSMKEYYQTLLYPLVLVYTYYEFLEKTDRAPNGLLLSDYVYDRIPDVVIGQLAGQSDTEDIYEEIEPALLSIVEHLQYTVYKVLSAKMTELDVLVWMHSTFEQPTVMEEDLDGILEEVEFYPSNYEEYSSWIEENFLDLSDKVTSEYAYGEAYDYISSLMNG